MAILVGFGSKPKTRSKWPLFLDKKVARTAPDRPFCQILPIFFVVTKKLQAYGW